MQRAASLAQWRDVDRSRLAIDRVRRRDDGRRADRRATSPSCLLLEPRSTERRAVAGLAPSRTSQRAEDAMIASIRSRSSSSRAARRSVADTCVRRRRPDRSRDLPAWTRLDAGRLRLADFAARTVRRSPGVERRRAVHAPALRPRRLDAARLADGRWASTFLRCALPPELASTTTASPRRDDDNSREVLADSRCSAGAFAAGLVDWVDSSARDHRRGPTRAARPGTSPGRVSVSHPLAGAEAVITGDLMRQPIQCCDPQRRVALQCRL